jgi:hypothetical protein
MGSRSNSKQATTNNDNRVAVDSGLGLSASSKNVLGGLGLNLDKSNANTFSINTSDPAIVTRALNSVDVANAGMSDGFTKLLDAAGSLFDRGETLIGRTQTAVADAYGRAQTDTKGGIDQRTMIVLAVAGAAALAFSRRK